MAIAKSPEFRQRALDLVAQGTSVSQVARDLGISETALRRWKAQAEADAGVGPGLTTAERKELAELRKRNRELKMEAEILKSANAFFAREGFGPK